MSIKMSNQEREHLISMVNQLMSEREVLYRENQYLKAKLNDSLLIETINEMKKERNLLLTILSNLTINTNQDEQLRYVRSYFKENNIDFFSSPSYSKFNAKITNCNKSLTEHNLTLPRFNSSTKPIHNRAFRLKANTEQCQPASVIYRIDTTKENLLNNSDRSSSTSSVAQTKSSNGQPSKTSYVYKAAIAPQVQVQEPTKLNRKYNFQLKHSLNSPFKQYRSQSLQDLT